MEAMNKIRDPVLFMASMNRKWFDWQLNPAFPARCLKPVRENRNAHDFIADRNPNSKPRVGTGGAMSRLPSDSLRIPPIQP